VRFLVEKIIFSNKPQAHHRGICNIIESLRIHSYLVEIIPCLVDCVIFQKEILIGWFVEINEFLIHKVLGSIYEA
jgi:hypothetical protein